MTKNTKNSDTISNNIHQWGNMLFAALTFTGSLSVFVVIKSRMLGISPRQLCIKFLEGLYFPHFNICLIGDVAGENIFIIFYQFLFFAILTAALICILTQKIFKKQNKYSPPSLQMTVRWILLFSFIFMTGLQQIKRQERFIKEFRRFAGKTVSEKNKLLFGAHYYQFIEAARLSLPGRHNAAFLTDEDLSQDPWMTWQRRMAYDLFPNVSFRYQLNAPNDCLILFYKKNDVEKILKEYDIITASEDRTHILAIRKGAPR